jgi:DNA-binding NarL/FixJ family response regulator
MLPTAFSAEKINILIADDHAIFRSGLKNALKPQDFIDRIYEASDGSAALLVCEKQPVHIVLMDIGMKPMNGLQATAEIRRRFPHIRIIALSVSDQPRSVVEMYENGASGYLLKDSDPDEIYRAVRMVHNNEEYYSPRVSNYLMKFLLKKEQGKPLHSNGRLSGREIEILRLLCRQMNNEEIGSKMFLSPFTVKTHRQHILEKTNSRSLAALIIYALRHKLVTLEEL